MTPTPNYERPLPTGFGIRTPIEQKRALLRAAVTWFVCSYLLYLLSFSFSEPGTVWWLQAIGIMSWGVGMANSIKYWFLRLPRKKA